MYTQSLQISVPVGYDPMKLRIWLAGLGSNFQIMQLMDR